MVKTKVKMILSKLLFKTLVVMRWILARLGYQLVWYASTDWGEDFNEDAFQE